MSEVGGCGPFEKQEHIRGKGLLWGQPSPRIRRPHEPKKQSTPVGLSSPECFPGRGVGKVKVGGSDAKWPTSLLQTALEEEEDRREKAAHVFTFLERY